MRWISRYPDFFRECPQPHEDPLALVRGKPLVCEEAIGNHLPAGLGRYGRQG
jgi:hypothetical protein